MSQPLDPPVPVPDAAPTRQWLRALLQPRSILFLLFLLSPLVAWAFSAPWYVSTGLFVLALLLSAALLNKRGGMGWVGPHFYYDLVRLGRRARTWDARIIYSTLLLAGIALVYFFRFPIRDWESLFVAKGSIGLSDASNLAQRFAFTIVFLQNLAVFLLAPPYLAPVIAEERERGTLELLYTTHLRSHQIVLGKFFARMVHLAVILLGGLPILSLVQLWGGLDIPTLLGNFLLLFMNLLAVGSVALLASTLAKRVVTAVMCTYGIVIPIAFCFGGLSLGTGEGFMGMYEMRPAWAVGALFLHVPVTVTCLVGALVAMRADRLSENRMPPRVPRHMRRPQPPPLNEVIPVARLAEEEERQPSIMQVRHYDLPPLVGDPLYWKEMSLGHRPFYKSIVFYTILGLAGYIVVSVFLSLLVGTSFDHVDSWSDRAAPLGYALRGLGILYATLLCLGMGFYAAAALVRERQNKTLDSLLTLPMGREAILKAKWLASLNRNLGWLLGLWAMATCGLITGGMHFTGAMLLAAFPVFHAAFFNSLGLYLSVVCRTLIEAYVKLALFFFALIAGTWLAGLVFEWAGWRALSNVVGVGLNPVLSWWAISFSYPDFYSQNQRISGQLFGALVGLCVYTVGAIVFWFLACRTFQREQYRHVE